MDDNDDNVIDIEASESPISRGMRRRNKRLARKARTGDNGEKTSSRVFWIALGSVIGVVAIRAVEHWFPRKAPVVALPAGTVPTVAAEIEIL